MPSLRTLAVLGCGTVWAASPLTVTGQTNTGPHGDSSAIAIVVVHSDDPGMSDGATMGIERLTATRRPHVTRHSERERSMR